MENLLEVVKSIRNVNVTENEIILKEFEYLFRKNSKIIKEILNKENSIFNTDFQYDKLLESFNVLNNYQYINLKQYVSIGTIVCVTDGDTYFILEMLIKAILSKSKIVFLVDRYMLSINTYLIELMKNALEKYNINNRIVSIENNTNNKIIGHIVDRIDCIVINKNFELYKELQELYNIKVIYSDYGNINIYSDSKEFDTEIDNVCKDAKMQNKQVFIAVTDDIEEYINNMNNNFLFYSIVIYTKNAGKCAYFSKNVKAENVYINRNPFEFNDLNFDEYEFLYKKRIIY